jgi:hypothetical protein
MSRNRINRGNVPPGFISRKDYPIGQLGGSMKQEGGFAFLPAIAAAYAGLKAVQPFSKAKRALEENVDNKNSNWYKIPHKIASIGTSLGFGDYYTGSPLKNHIITSQVITRAPPMRMIKSGSKTAKKYHVTNRKISRKPKHKRSQK